ncbi:MAG TPA: FAD-dependent oxidoreductase [Mycobacteriales bacterium]|nr:FAD-dependent oxidoreductase [Mycobacteriales bacterium]
MRERMVVIGADAAGMSAASQARRRRSPDDLEIVAFERGGFTSYSACGIPYWISGDVPDRDALVARTPAELRTAYAVDVRMRTEVEAIDLDRREVVARERETGRDVRCGFDVLVVATGAVPVRPELPGVDAAGVFGVQTLDDGVAVREALDAGARRAVVVGGGYIGVEMAEALVKRGLRVTLVERAAEPMSTLDPDMGRLVREAMLGMGIDVRSGQTVQGFAVADGRIRAVVTERGEVAADLVVLGIGVRPNTGLAAAAGLPLGPTGGLRTDRRMRVSGVEGVWAAGDCVETYDLVARQPVHVPLGTHANKQGRVIGINVGGGYATFPGIVRTAVSKVCELEIARTGLREADVERAGLRCVTATVDSTTRAGYYPGAAPITTKIIAEKSSGRLLGAQIVGREGAAKRIDALAVALWAGLTVDDMTGLDLGYAPPFAPVWDPVLITARKAQEAVEADLRRGVTEASCTER